MHRKAFARPYRAAPVYRRQAGARETSLRGRGCRLCAERRLTSSKAPPSGIKVHRFYVQSTDHRVSATRPSGFLKMDHPGPSAPVAGGSTSDLVEPASRRYSVNDIDELEGYLTRLAKLSSALPSKASLPNSPRSPSQRFHFAGGSATASLDAAVSPTTPASPLSRNGSSREASPRPSSTLEPFASYIAASNWLQGSLPIRRVRSKSLSDGSNSRVLSSPTVPSQPTSPQGPKSPLTAAHAGKRTAPPISWTPVASSTGRPGQRTPESQTAGSPQRSNTFVTAVPTDKFGSRRKIKRRSIPSPLPIASPSVGSAIEAGPSSARSESVHFTSFSIAESSEGEADASDPDIQVSRPASTATTTGPNIDRADTTDGVCNLRAETPVQASSVAHRTRRAMSSPLTSPAMADSLSTQSFRTSSTSSGGHLQARPSTANSQTRLQARSPFSGQSSPEWRKRHFPRRAASYDNDDVDEEATYHGQSRQRELMTATQALAELGRHEPAEPVVKARSRKISRESFSSKGSSLFEKGGKSLDDPRRESIDSRASSSHSIRLFGRSGKAPTMPASQTQSFGSVYSQPSPVATTSSGISAQQTRKPRLQARDDRHPPIRPKFTSTRSTSSLPLNGGNDTSAHDLTAGLSSDDDLDHRNPRRASIPNASAIYAAASTVLSNRASLAVPPAFGRSYSYDDSASHAALNPDLRAADNSVNARTRDMAQAVLLWVPDDAGSAVKVGHGRQLTKVLLGNVPRKKVTKRDSTHVLSAQADEGRPSTAKGKEVAKDRLPSTIPSGRWRQCEAVLKPTGQLSLFSDVRPRPFAGKVYTEIVCNLARMHTSPRSLCSRCSVPTFALRIPLFSAGCVYLVFTFMIQHFHPFPPMRLVSQPRHPCRTFRASARLLRPGHTASGPALAGAPKAHRSQRCKVVGLIYILLFQA